jgi:hypothetical protein
MVQMVNFDNSIRLQILFVDAFSLGRLLANLSTSEREIWTQLLFEATGVGDSIDRILQKIDTVANRSFSGDTAPYLIKVRCV